MKRLFFLSIILLVLSSCGRIASCSNDIVVHAISQTASSLFDFQWIENPSLNISTLINKEPEQQKPITRNIIHQQEGVVEVVMKFAENGQWKVVNLSATNEELARYVLARLKEYHPQTPNKMNGQVVKYRFVFKQQT
jgi:hypothetical protein